MVGRSTSTLRRNKSVEERLCCVFVESDGSGKMERAWQHAAAACMCTMRVRLCHVCLYAGKAKCDNLSGTPSRGIYGLCVWSINIFPDICIVDGHPIYQTAFGKPRDTVREMVHKPSLAKSTSNASKGIIGGIPVCCRSLS